MGGRLVSTNQGAVMAPASSGGHLGRLPHARAARLACGVGIPDSLVIANLRRRIFASQKTQAGCGDGSLVPAGANFAALRIPRSEARPNVRKLYSQKNAKPLILIALCGITRNEAPQYFTQRSREFVVRNNIFLDLLIFPALAWSLLRILRASARTHWQA